MSLGPESLGQQPKRPPTIAEIQAAARAKKAREEESKKALREGKKLEPGAEPAKGKYSPEGDLGRVQAQREKTFGSLSPDHPLRRPPSSEGSLN